MPRRSRHEMRDRRRAMRDRRMRDYRSGRGMHDYGYSMGDYGSEYSGRYDSAVYPEHEYARAGRYSQSGREYDRHYEYPYIGDYARSRRTGRYVRDYRDYASGEDYLEDEELMEWQKDLIDSIEPQYKQHFERSRVLQRAKEMGVKFKDYSENEYYVTALMMATDYGKTVGMSNVDLMLRMAVNWLEDDDAELQGSEKLAVYYDEIICAED